MIWRSNKERFILRMSKEWKWYFVAIDKALAIGIGRFRLFLDFA